MDADAFTRPSGELKPLIGGGLAFVPTPLPPAGLELARLAIPVSAALQALGELKGVARRLSNPWLLIQPMQRAEALSTSAMEGTFTTIDQLVLEEAEVGGGSADAREVANFIRALNWASGQLDKGMPIAHRLLCGTHEILLKDVRGANKRPGEYKREQNIIGGVNRDVASARFVPPPPELTPALMAQLERFINDRERDSPFQALVDIALVHYQFETIHPFPDGNGRLGRMLITLLARRWGLLDHLLLYVSPELEERKSEYIDRLFAVSARSAWEEWISFFAEIVVRSCSRIIDTIDDLVALHDDFRARAIRVGRSSNLQKVVDELFRSPVVTTPSVERQLGVTYAAARNIIEKLEKAGILTAIPDTRPQAWRAPAIIDLIRR